MRARTALPLVAAVLLVVTGCSTGSSTAAGSFGFVSPGGRTEITYDPPSTRGTIGPLAGVDLLEDTPLAVADFAGEVVVLNLWGQWCGPCRAEADDLEEVAEATAGLGVQLLGINVRDPQRDKAQDFVRDRAVTYPSIYDPSMRTLAALGGDYPTSVIPSTIVLDRQHRVAAIFLRALTAEDLLPVVQRIAAEPPESSASSEPSGSGS